MAERASKLFFNMRDGQRLADRLRARGWKEGRPCLPRWPTDRGPTCFQVVSLLYTGTAVRGTQGWGCGHVGVVRVASDITRHQDLRMAKGSHSGSLPIGERWRHRSLPGRGNHYEAIRRALVRSPPLAPVTPSSPHAKAFVAISELEIGHSRRPSSSVLVVRGCVVLAVARGRWCGVGFSASGGRLILWVFSGGSRSGERAGRSRHRRPPPVILGSWRLLSAGPR